MVNSEVTRWIDERKRGEVRVVLACYLARGMENCGPEGTYVFGHTMFGVTGRGMSTDGLRTRINGTKPDIKNMPGVC